MSRTDTQETGRGQEHGQGHGQGQGHDGTWITSMHAPQSTSIQPSEPLTPCPGLTPAPLKGLAQSLLAAAHMKTRLENWIVPDRHRAFYHQGSESPSLGHA